jgi:glycerol-3-phosphate O-acyltransferase
MTSKIIEEWDHTLKQSDLPIKIIATLKEFIPYYLKSAKIPAEESEKLLKTFLEKVAHQIKTPHHFEPFHKAIHKPFDYFQFGLDFIRPLVNFNQSFVEGLEQIHQIEKQCANKENIILLSNHQIEPDPQVIGLLLESTHPNFTRNMIFVAGHRVTTDPLAVPLSLGCNLLCIYSKKHINHPPEDKSEKILHNQKTLQKMQELLQEGGKCLYIAPSGGRDRINSKREIEVAPFDAANIELFRLIAEQTRVPVHFYPLAIDSYDLLPPPESIEKEIGERRAVSYAPIKMAIGPEINMDHFPGSQGLNKREIRTLRAEWIWQWVSDAFVRLHFHVKDQTKDEIKSHI